MHTREAREDGETNERLDRLVVWRHVDDYTPREKAALAFTEAMTRLDDKSVLPELRAALREHFSEQEVAALAADVAIVTLWKRSEERRVGQACVSRVNTGGLPA